MAVVAAGIDVSCQHGQIVAVGNLVRVRFSRTGAAAVCVLGIGGKGVAVPVGGVVYFDYSYCIRCCLATDCHCQCLSGRHRRTIKPAYVGGGYGFCFCTLVTVGSRYYQAGDV
ncbi:hypothetical protein [Desulfosporosinus sp. Sb-LF]|uniref:hypothetical protein n=1 Tax=Desulfosporosinus sp. Sb-LF TaxID=2560027 RepID=UPI001FB0A4B1|nr:hypothetical protein [Desulfosporosinus sp. Sb-LF]